MEQSVAKEVFEMKTPEEIKAIKLALIDFETTCGHCPYEGEPNGCNRPGGICKMFDVALDADEAISQLEAQQPRWISVGERLPEDDGYVLCHCNDGSPDVVCMYYGDGEFVTPELDNITHIVTHWMPLPQPPEEGN